MIKLISTKKEIWTDFYNYMTCYVEYNKQYVLNDSITNFVCRPIWAFFKQPIWFHLDCIQYSEHDL